jgi:hypothetical protein
MDMRTFSRRSTDDSKFVESNVGRIADAVRMIVEIPHWMDASEVLAQHGIAKFPYACLLVGPVAYKGAALPAEIIEVVPVANGDGLQLLQSAEKLIGPPAIPASKDVKVSGGRWTSSTNCSRQNGPQTRPTSLSMVRRNLPIGEPSSMSRAHFVSLADRRRWRRDRIASIVALDPGNLACNRTSTEQSMPASGLPRSRTAARTTSQI